MIDSQKRPLVVLMHGDREVSTKNLARRLGVKELRPADPQTTQRLTGYQVGGISPFGTRQQPPVYIEASILALPAIYINAGKRGLLARMIPDELMRILNPTPVQVAI